MLLRGFFAGNETASSKFPLFLSPQCKACKLDQGCSTPRMPVDGEGRKKILVIAEAPGRTEDESGIPLCGRMGGLFERALAEFDVDMRRDCWLTNAIICRPPGNSTPTDKQVAWCRPHITSVSSDKNGNKIGLIHQLQPEMILLLGAAAVKSVIGWLWKEDTRGVNRWIGWKIPCQELNSWVTIAWHPSYVGREEKNRAVELIWKKHLREAASLKGRPWKKAPDYKSQVIVERVPRQAAQLIKEITKMGKPAAFDYECNMLKPDGDRAKIWSCSISNGAITVAYPWLGEAVDATQKFLQSPIHKIASNFKYEERWTVKEFGHGVNRWSFDTMLVAHLLDNRPNISSIKFQAFVLLGQPSWEDKVKPYFESSGPNVPNRIKDVDLRTLLEYNGMDSLMELEVAKIQADQLGVDL